GILRVHPHAGAVRALAVADTCIGAGHVLPCRALIVGTIEARSSLQCAADDVDALAVRVHRDGYADATGVRRQCLDFLPRLARVCGLEERGAVGRRWRRGTRCGRSRATETAASAT